MIPVTGNLVQVALCHERGLCQQPAAALLLVLDEALQKLNDACALRQQDRQSLTDNVACGEKLQLTAELVVVALLGFLHHGEVLFQQALLRERDAVETLQHLVACIAAPVCTCDGGELYSLDIAGAHEVRACAEVREIVLLIEGDVLALGSVLTDELLFIVLTLHELQCFRYRQLEALNLDVFLDDLLHLGFDLCEVVVGDGLRQLHIIIEAVIHSRADGELCARVQAVYRLRHDVGRGVPICLFALFIVKRQNLYLAIFVEHGAQVAHLAVHFCGTCGLIKTHADAFCDFRYGNAAFKFLFAALQINLDHDSQSFPNSLIK